tara:strand:- start:110 stop:622 length:513 start_codon:yes stop_codon:yes gene_type:complete
MAFKMTPGMKGSPQSNSIMGGGCGGDGQPPCPPRFQAEKITAPVADRSSSSRSKSIRPKKKAAVVKPTPAPVPVKFKINLPEGYKFKSKKEEMKFYQSTQIGIDGGEFKSQEQLDTYVMKQLRGGAPSPFDPQNPVIDIPIKEGPIMVPIKGGESEAVISKPKAKSVVAK